MKFNLKKTIVAAGIMSIAITTMSFTGTGKQETLGHYSQTANMSLTGTSNTEEEAGWKESVLRTVGQFTLSVLAHVATHYLIGGAEQETLAAEADAMNAQRVSAVKMAGL